MIVRIKYEDGSTEDHELKNGVHFADVNGGKDVPGSKLAFKLGGQQVRYLTVRPGRRRPIASIELVKGRDRSPRSSWRRQSKASSDRIEPAGPFPTEIRF